MHTYTLAHIHIHHTHTCTHTHTHILTYKHIHICMHTCTHIHIHTHTYTPTHTHPHISGGQHTWARKRGLKWCCVTTGNPRMRMTTKSSSTPRSAMRSSKETCCSQKRLTIVKIRPEDDHHGTGIQRTSPITSLLPPPPTKGPLRLAGGRSK